MFDVKGLPMHKILPLLAQMGTYLKLGVDHYAMLKAAGKDAGPEILAAYMLLKMADWNPKIGTRLVMDTDTKAAAARFLAGVVVNVADI